MYKEDVWGFTYHCNFNTSKNVETLVHLFIFNKSLQTLYYFPLLEQLKQRESFPRRRYTFYCNAYPHRNKAFTKLSSCPFLLGLFFNDEKKNINDKINARRVTPFTFSSFSCCELWVLNFHSFCWLFFTWKYIACFMHVLTSRLEGVLKTTWVDKHVSVLVWIVIVFVCL